MNERRKTITAKSFVQHFNLMDPVEVDFRLILTAYWSLRLFRRQQDLSDFALRLLSCSLTEFDPLEFGRFFSFRIILPPSVLVFVLVRMPLLDSSRLVTATVRIWISSEYIALYFVSRKERSRGAKIGGAQLNRA